MNRHIQQKFERATSTAAAQLTHCFSIVCIHESLVLTFFLKEISKLVSEFQSKEMLLEVIYSLKSMKI
jgi:hypothetical protein